MGIKKKSVADRIYEDPEGTYKEKNIYWVITYVRDNYLVRT